MGCLSYLFPPRLGDAELVVVQPGGAQSGLRIPVRFILRSYRLSRQNISTETPIAGLPGAPVQFVRGQPRLLSLALVFDARAENRDVRESMQAIAGLMGVDQATHAPPLLRFEWKEFSLKCVLEGATEEITSPYPDGRPSRARLQVTFKEARTLAELQDDLNLQ